MTRNVAPCVPYESPDTLIAYCWCGAPMEMGTAYMQCTNPGHVAFQLYPRWDAQQLMQFGKKVKK